MIMKLKNKSKKKQVVRRVKESEENAYDWHEIVPGEVKEVPEGNYNPKVFDEVIEIGKLEEKVEKPIEEIIPEKVPEEVVEKVDEDFELEEVRVHAGSEEELKKLSFRELRKIGLEFNPPIKDRSKKKIIIEILKAQEEEK